MSYDDVLNTPHKELDDHSLVESPQGTDYDARKLGGEDQDKIDGSVSPHHGH